MTVAQPLSSHYQRFNVANRLLLTGHSHQAWPDVAEGAMLESFRDAAELVDGKWERAFAKAERVRQGFAALLDDDGSGEYSLGPSTHDLLIKFLSALPLTQRPKLVSTTGEFHSLDRQLKRLGETGVEIVRVPVTPFDTLSERLRAAIDDRTAAVLASWVFFETARIAKNLGDVLQAAQKRGAELLIDAYHALNVVDVSLQREKLSHAYVVGGGYKYCQLGEGNCFLRYPKDSGLRPVWTGWFADFASLEDRDHAGPVRFHGERGQRFAGATYDPVSHYRAAAVFDFFEKMRLTPKRLREISQHQIGLLMRGFDALNADPKRVARDVSQPLAETAGFLALRTPHAAKLCAVLKDRGVHTDYRGEILRLGPAPYLSDEQIKSALALLDEALTKL